MDFHPNFQGSRGEIGVFQAPKGPKRLRKRQLRLSRMARDFPGAFAGYKLEVTESHQKTKADTSGTAKAMAPRFWEHAQLFCSKS